MLACGLALALGARCTDEDGAASGISVTQARAAGVERPLLVSGYVVAEGGRVRLCEALAESFPPQCGGPSLEVRGLDVASVPGLEASDGVRWTARPHRLLGVVRDGILTVSGSTVG